MLVHVWNWRTQLSPCTASWGTVQQGELLARSWRWGLHLHYYRPAARGLLGLAAAAARPYFVRLLRCQVLANGDSGITSQRFIGANLGRFCVHSFTVQAKTAYLPQHRCAEARTGDDFLPWITKTSTAIP